MCFRCSCSCVVCFSSTEAIGLLLISTAICLFGEMGRGGRAEDPLGVAFIDFGTPVSADSAAISCCGCICCPTATVWGVEILWCDTREFDPEPECTTNADFCFKTDTTMHQSDETLADDQTETDKRGNKEDLSEHPFGITVLLTLDVHSTTDPVPPCFLESLASTCEKA